MKNKIITFLILFLICGIFVGLGIWFKDCVLFQYNLLEIISGIAVAYALYYLTKINEQKNNQNNRIQEVIELIQKKISSVFEKPVDVSEKKEYLHTFKYLDNKIRILEIMTSELKCEIEIEKIKTEKDSLEKFVTENLNEGNDYFVKESVKDKIPNILGNIENQLDNITVKIYNFKTKKK